MTRCLQPPSRLLGGVQTHAEAVTCMAPVGATRPCRGTAVLQACAPAAGRGLIVGWGFFSAGLTAVQECERMACPASCSPPAPRGAAAAPLPRDRTAVCPARRGAQPCRWRHEAAGVEPVVPPARATQLRLKALVRTAGGGAELNALEPSRRAAEPPPRGLPPLS